MEKILRRAIDPLRILINDSRFTGIMLIVCTLVSIILANSPALSAAIRTFGACSGLQPLHLPGTLSSWIKLPHGILFPDCGMEIRESWSAGNYRH